MPKRVRHTRKEQKERYYAKKRVGSINSGSRWTIKEIKMILEKKLSDSELHKILKRTVQSIQIKRSRLKTGNI
jgi:hypothetical protein